MDGVVPHGESLHQLPADENRRAGNNILPEQTAVIHALRHGERVAVFVIVFGNERRAREKEARFRVLCRERHLALELFGHPEIVAVEKGDPIAPRLAHTAVARFRYAAVLRLRDHTDARLFRRVALCQSERSVRRGIVHDEHLELTPCLQEDGIERGGKRFFGAPRRHDHTDETPFAHFPVPSDGLYSLSRYFTNKPRKMQSLI